MLVGVLNLIAIIKCSREPGRDVKILSDRILRIEGSAQHSRWTCIDKPSRSADETLRNNAPHRNCLRKKNTACVTLFFFFTIRRGTFPYTIEDNASTTSQTPTTHYTNTCVKLTIVTHLSFSERIAIANLGYSVAEAPILGLSGKHETTTVGSHTELVKGAQVKLTNTDLPNMYRRSTTETIMYHTGQNILLLYPYFGIAFLQPPQSLNSEDSETVKFDHFPSSLRKIIQTPTGKYISSLPGWYPYRNGYLLNLIFTFLDSKYM